MSSGRKNGKWCALPVPGGLSSADSDPPTPVSPRISASGAGLRFTNSPFNTIFDTQGFFFSLLLHAYFCRREFLQQVSSTVSVCPMPLWCSPKWKLSVNPSCSPNLQIRCPDLPLPGSGYRNGDVGGFINSCAVLPLACMGPWALGGTWPLPGPAMQPWSVFPSILLGMASWS